MIQAVNTNSEVRHHYILIYINLSILKLYMHLISNHNLHSMIICVKMNSSQWTQAKDISYFQKLDI